MSDAWQDRVAHRAYLIWVGAGRPWGRDVEHWLHAEHELATEGDSGEQSSRVRFIRHGAVVKRAESI